MGQMPANVETMAYVRETPWHGLGTKVEGLMTAQEALDKAGLLWTVLQSPLTYQSPDGSATIQVPGKVANMRSTDAAFLGIVGDGYQIVQNTDAFDWTDNLVESSDAKYETAGALFNGRRVWLSMELPEGVKVPGDDGEIKPYILVTNGHDGGTALQASITMVRTVCANTWTLALGSAIRTVKIRHSGDVEVKFAQAQKTLGIAVDYAATFARIGEMLVEKRVTQKQAEKVLETVFPLPARAKANKDRVSEEAFGQVLAVYQNSENLQNIRGTAWGVLQAVGEYLDHVQVYRGRVFDPQEVRMDSILYDGPTAAKKQLAYKILADRDFARAR